MPIARDGSGARRPILALAAALDARPPSERCAVLARNDVAVVEAMLAGSGFTEF